MVPPYEVSLWIKKIIAVKWRDAKPVANALAQMSRRTGDKARDIDPAMIEEVIEWMCENNCTSHTRLLKEVVPMERQEESAIFGEDLPSGLVIHM